MVVGLESIQIRSLQRVVACQDDLLRNELGNAGPISSVWRNECYRLSVQRSIAEDESVRLGILCVEMLRSQREHMRAAIFPYMDGVIEESTLILLEKIDSSGRRLVAVERKLHALRSQLEGHRYEVSLLTRRNSALEELIGSLREQVAQKDVENSQLKAKIHDIQQARVRPETPRRGIDVAIHASPDTVNEVQLLLTELRALEEEAKQMLIKP